MIPSGRYATDEQVLAAIAKTYHVDLSGLLKLDVNEHPGRAVLIKAAHAVFKTARQQMLVNNAIRRHAEGIAGRLTAVANLAASNSLTMMFETYQTGDDDNAALSTDRIGQWIAMSEGLSEALNNMIQIFLYRDDVAVRS